MASGVPYLSLDSFAIDDEGFGLKLDADGGFGIDVELVPRKPSEKLGLADGGVTDQHHFENVIDLLVEIAVQIRHHSLSISSCCDQRLESIRISERKNQRCVCSVVAVWV